MLRTRRPGGRCAAAGVDPADVIGIGTDFTACTMVPDDSRTARRCASCAEFGGRPHAYAKLWKHHAAQPQADRINELAAQPRGEPWLPRYGGLISSSGSSPRRCRCSRRTPERLRGDAALGRGRRLDRLAAHRRATCATPAPPATRASCRTARYPSADFLAALDPGFAAFVADKLEQPAGPARRPRRRR